MSEAVRFFFGGMILLWMGMSIMGLAGIERELKFIRKALEKIAGDKDLK